MLKVQMFEFVARLIPEAFIFMFSAYTFSRIRLEKNKYLLSSLLLSLSVFIIRMLPINYGVHTILNIIILTVIANIINKINMVDAIKSTITTTVLLFVLEGISVVMLKSIFNDQLQIMFQDPKLKIIFGLPSLITFGIIVIGYYTYLNKKEKLTYV